MTLNLTRKLAAGLALAGAAIMASPAVAQGCSRDFLEEMAAGYVQGQTEGRMLGKLPFGEWLVVRENFTRSSLSQGLLSKPMDIAWSMSLLDTSACKVFVEYVVLEPEPYVIAAQFSHGFFGVSEVSLVTSTTGDWLFDARATYDYARREDWGVLPEAQRRSRAELIAAADAYLDLFNDKSVEVPWGIPCRRLEGGIYTGRGTDQDSCDVGVPEGVELVERDYIVDEEKGAVAVFLRFGGEDGLPDVHTFRMVDGRIANIHTVTNCNGQPNCGFPPLSEMLERNPDAQPDPALFGEPRG